MPPIPPRDQNLDQGGGAPAVGRGAPGSVGSLGSVLAAGSSPDVLLLCLTLLVVLSVPLYELLVWFRQGQPYIIPRHGMTDTFMIPVCAIAIAIAVLGPRLPNNGYPGILAAVVPAALLLEWSPWRRHR